jgi:hypothetical protein
MNLRLAAALSILALAAIAPGQGVPEFKVLGFSTSKDDAGHVVYEREANMWLPKMGALHGFKYDSTKNWSDCNPAKLAQYQVVIFFDERPEVKSQRDAIRAHIDAQKGFIACHGAAFALNGSQQLMNWSWYHDTLFGSGEYRSNTWRPTSAFLKREDSTHPFMAGIPALFKSSPNEWYRWKTDLKTKKDIKILLSIDPTSFPLGTGPKQEEIWHEGYYPVAWTNVKYNMLYVNMGHNDINSPGTGKDSETFANETQNKLFLNALLKMGRGDATALRPAAGAKSKSAPRVLRKGARAVIEAGNGREFEVRGRESAAGKVMP